MNAPNRPDRARTALVRSSSADAARVRDMGAPLVATLGVFDGLHAGHRQLIEAVSRERARLPETRSALISFYPHPDAVLGKAKHVPSLGTRRSMLALLSEAGIEFLVLQRFSPEFAKISAADFMRRVVIERLNVRHLVLGPDTHVGYRREGTPEFIVDVMRAAGRSAEIVKPLLIDGAVVSSARLRALVQRGDLDAARRLLGRPFALDGRVVHGQGRGRTLGIPTANLFTAGQVLPEKGVYFTRAGTAQGSFFAITNVGVRPTFGGSALSVEAHLLDYPGADLYRARLTLEFLERIRDERKFASKDELVTQIRADEIAARKLAGEVKR